ncbi:MAG: hypothetical protein AVDCRST_MAG12-1693 [uncultured Rubrobacteraceae bacterium]|uniref:HYR domain-containing protein n=1 Tax=uncultured Rubrobacteraceae bacterium TaxID=349277 RepID=A0A6J4S383_9ACTN|nr:MAG: hypothetical protein AVDCRST_MAG12-1693 [uncultured Rubrobacteraceae bacterium]
MRCTATDSRGNSAEETFGVTVRDTAAPDVRPGARKRRFR